MRQIVLCSSARSDSLVSLTLRRSGKGGGWARRNAMSRLARSQETYRNADRRRDRSLRNLDLATHAWGPRPEWLRTPIRNRKPISSSLYNGKLTVARGVQAFPRLRGVELC